LPTMEVMECKCMIANCSTEFDPGQGEGWVGLSLFLPVELREGAVCPRHAYCLGSFLGGSAVIEDAEVSAPRADRDALNERRARPVRSRRAGVNRQA
jgi:hypothetical protein